MSKQTNINFNFPVKAVMTLHEVKANSGFDLSVIEDALGTKVKVEGLGNFTYRDLANAGNIVGVVGIPDRVYDSPITDFRNVLSNNISHKNEPHFVIFDGIEYKLFLTTVCIFRAAKFQEI